MKISGLIHSLPGYVRAFLFCFTLSLGFGYAMGYKFLVRTTDLQPSGIEMNYNGNENDDEAVEMKFKKSEREMLSIIHSHAISMSLIFFALGAIVSITSISDKVKLWLITKPLISIIVTFGGVWLLWKGVAWMKYIVMVSGIIMTLSVVGMILVIWWQLLKKPTLNS